MTPAPIARAGMLIRRPRAAVFDAFVDPAVTTRFWFTGSSGRLGPGARVRWDWAMYGASSEVAVTAFEPETRFVMEWNGPEHPSEVEWTFADRPGGTFVEVANRGFAADAAGVEAALDAAGGFALVLAGAKVWLEHAIEPGFVAARFPDALAPDWRSA